MRKGTRYGGAGDAEKEPCVLVWELIDAKRAHEWDPRQEGNHHIGDDGCLEENTCVEWTLLSTCQSLTV